MRLGIGTVQFGLNYGIANQHGKVNLDQSRAIINYAKELGIDTLDTAAAYGESELVLGQCDLAGMRLVSKLQRLPTDLQDAAGWAEEQTKATLLRCKQTQLYGFLFHHADDLFTSAGHLAYQRLILLKEAGVIKKLGVSAYHPEQLDKILLDFDFDLVQLPLNVIDRRFCLSGCLDRLKKRNIEIHARSLFLQGLLLMNPTDYPDYFKPWKPLLEQWHLWVMGNSMSPLEACIQHVKSYQEIDRMIVGVENIKQLSEIASSFIREAQQAPAVFSLEEERLINPSNWSS